MRIWWFRGPQLWKLLEPGFEHDQSQRRQAFEAMMQQMLLVAAAEELLVARIVQKVASWASVDLHGTTLVAS